MKKSIYLVLVLAFCYSISYAQKSVNSFKYILVPKHYEFLKSPDKYQVNSLTKFLFDKAGFTTLHSDEKFPEDLASNSCLALRAIVVDNSGMFSTKLTIKLFDCHNTVVYETKEGRSKEKDYKAAYHEAIRKTFVELEELGYTYEESKNNAEQSVVIKKAEEVSMKPVVEVEKAIEVAKSSEKKIMSVQEKVIVPAVAKEVKRDVVKLEKPAVMKKEIVVTEKPVIMIKEVAVREKDEKQNKPTLKKPVIYSLEGTYTMDKWGTCIVSKTEKSFSVVGGDENFEFATIFTTSRPAVFIIKWAAYKQPQLLEINTDGNLKIDTESGVQIYKRLK